MMCEYRATRPVGTTTAAVRRCLEDLEHRTLGWPAMPLRSLLAAAVGRDAREGRLVAAAVSAGMRALAGDDWGALTGGAARAVIHRALATLAAGGDGR